MRSKYQHKLPRMVWAWFGSWLSWTGDMHDMVKEDQTLNIFEFTINSVSYKQW